MRRTARVVQVMNLTKRAKNWGRGGRGFIEALKSHMIYFTDVWISFPEILL